MDRPAARELLASALVCDMVLPFEKGLEHKASILERYRAQGISYVSLTVGIDWAGVEETIRLIASERARIFGEPDRFMLVDKAADIGAARQSGKLAVSFNFQGSNGLGGDPAMLEVYHSLGLRQLILSYNSRNAAGDGCHEPADGGLSSYGRRLVAEMNRLGILVDCSHMGVRSSLEAIDVSSEPVVFSHSNARSVWNHERNITDEQIAACAARGGMIGVNGVGLFLGPNDASPDTFVGHVDHIVQQVGIDHVGLGLDLVYFEDTMYRIFAESPSLFPAGYPDPPWNFLQIESLGDVVEGLLQRGYCDDDVRKFLGLNFLRTASRVWG